MLNSVCVIIPAYNEQEKISHVVDYTKRFVSDIVVVDDGSEDKTEEAALDAGAVVLRHEKNLGKGMALRTGLDYAEQCGYRFAVTMDADGQHDSAEIPNLLVEIERSGADMVIASRMRHKAEMPLIRRFTNGLMSAVLSILVKKNCSDTQSGFRAVAVKKTVNLSLKTNRFDIESELFINAVHAGMRIREVDVCSIYKGNECSKIKVLPDTIRFVYLVIKNVIY
ncbi:MAG: glycosyltransferase family 2 protein [Planctomycetota bacterium]